jgi:hypothetical protein
MSPFHPLMAAGTPAPLGVKVADYGQDFGKIGLVEGGVVKDAFDGSAVAGAELQRDADDLGNLARRRGGTEGGRVSQLPTRGLGVGLGTVLAEGCGLTPGLAKLLFRGRHPGGQRLQVRRRATAVGAFTRVRHTRSIGRRPPEG